VKGFSDIGTSEERRYLLSGVLNTGAIASATLVLASSCDTHSTKSTSPRVPVIHLRVILNFGQCLEVDPWTMALSAIGRPLRCQYDAGAAIARVLFGNCATVVILIVDVIGLRRP
jgi:hypothetical protein